MQHNGNIVRQGVNLKRQSQADYSLAVDGGWKYFASVLIFFGIVTSIFTLLSNNNKIAQKNDYSASEGAVNVPSSKEGVNVEQKTFGDEQQEEDEEERRLRSLDKLVKMRASQQREQDVNKRESRHDENFTKHDKRKEEEDEEEEEEEEERDDDVEEEEEFEKKEKVSKAKQRSAKSRSVRTFRTKGEERPNGRVSTGQEHSRGVGNKYRPAVRTFRIKNGRLLDSQEKVERHVPKLQEDLADVKRTVKVIRKKGKVNNFEEKEEAHPAETTLDIRETPTAEHKEPTVRYVRVKPHQLASKGSVKVESSPPGLSIRYRRIKAKWKNSEDTMEEWKVLVPKVSIDYDSNSLVKTDQRNNAIALKIHLLPDDQHLLENRQVRLPLATHSITNQLDHRIRNRLEFADRLLNERRLEESLLEFETLLRGYPSSPRGRYGKAVSLDLLSDRRQSNEMLEKAIYAYEAMINLPNVPDELLRLAVQRLVERCRFRGWFDKAIRAQVRLLEKHPKEVTLLNEFAITLMMMSRYEDAKRVFLSIIDKDANNAEALLYLGYILKTVDHDHQRGAHFMGRGLALGVQLKQAARFVINLGDALNRLNRTEEAYELYDEASRHGIFLNRHQRSMYNVPELLGKPWWTANQMDCYGELKKLEREWRTYREECLKAWSSHNQTFERVDLYVESGDMQQMTVIFENGEVHEKNCALVPNLCSTIANLAKGDFGCKTGQARILVMQAGTDTWGHCSFTNCYITAIVGLALPHGSWLRVHNETKPMILGRLLLFDPSFEHQLHAGGTGWQLLVAFDLWHPELTEDQKESMTLL